MLNQVYLKSLLFKKKNNNKKKKPEIKDIAEEFNNIFTNVGPSLAKKLPNSSNPFTGF